MVNINGLAEEIFFCPLCGKGLTKSLNYFNCADCKKKWVIDEEIPCFSNKDLYWSHISKDKMVVLLNLAKKENYKMALKKILLPETNDYILDLALDESRADFMSILPINNKSVVLDLGCQWGAITIALARISKFVVAADTVIESLKFLQIRSKQESLSNIQPVQINPLGYGKLPFADSTFDVVILNGVLEWIGEGLSEKNPRNSQLKALKEIFRIIKPKGTLYVGIENRFSFLYFLGKKDHHGLPFTSILPRCLANLLMRIIKNKRYKTYTYSLAGYRSLFKKAGFTKSTFFIPLPTYHKPSYLIPAEKHNPNKYLFNYLLTKNNYKSPFYKIIITIAKYLYPLKLYKYFCPSYSIVVEK